ncbi:MAG: PAS domain-containing sensor histidine kinase, partial [Bacteroidia bacterium]|nr:PAS domain-containing sensor histidine kinase [Bacteroidia bacterium]
MELKEGSLALFEYATEGILITNGKSEIIRINPSAEKMFGYEKGELIGKKIEALVPRRFEKKHEGHRDGFNKKPHPRSMGIGMDLFGLRKDGTELPVEVSLSPFEAADGMHVIAFIIDITLRKKSDEDAKKQSGELKRLSEELKKTNADLEKRVQDRTLILEEALSELEKSRLELSQSLEKEKDLNELKSRFVSMASHEFRTPLATILSSLSLASKYGKQGESEKQEKHINRIKSSITHMTDLMNDVLSISKLEEGKISISSEVFDIKAFSVNIISELQVVTKKGQKILYTHSGNEKVFLDKKILKNILFNLISNAIKFSPEDKPIEVSIGTNETEIIISVEDHGIGIAEEDRKHLFERFFRGTNAANIQGTGLGLNIVVKYVELLEGKIDMTSELNKGTTFTIVLPNNKPHETSAD